MCAIAENRFSVNWRLLVKEGFLKKMLKNPLAAATKTKSWGEAGKQNGKKNLLQNPLAAAATAAAAKTKKCGGGTMGYFRESSYAYMLLKKCTILTTITSTTSIHKEGQQQPPLPLRNHYVVFACYIQRGRYFRF